MKRRDMTSEALIRRMDRLMAGDVREAVAIADAFARELKALEIASAHDDAKQARKYVNGIIREARRTKRPENVAMLVYQLIAGEPALRRAIA